MKSDDPYDVDSLRGPEVDLGALRNRRSKKLPRHRQGEKFLPGPIPWAWVDSAGRLRGQALFLALWLWREAVCNKSTTIRFRLAGAPAALGMHADTAKRNLRALAGAGLVTIQHRPGRALEVTINKAPAGAPSEQET